VVGQLRTLPTSGPRWQLPVNCLTYCSHVHAHHGLEGLLLFPARRRTNPVLASVATSERQTTGRSPASSARLRRRRSSSAYPAEARSRLANALAALADVRLEHLAYAADAMARHCSR
jgi:hypothetical protein